MRGRLTTSVVAIAVVGGAGMAAAAAGTLPAPLRAVADAIGLARPVNTVFPNGLNFKGGTYGTDVNAPVPQQEQNNPKYTPGSCKQDVA